MAITNNVRNTTKQRTLTPPSRPDSCDHSLTTESRGRRLTHISGKVVASLLTTALLTVTSAFGANTYLTNPLALQYSGTDFTNLTTYYYQPTALIVTSGCNASAAQFQAARAQGAEVLEYIDPVELPSWNCSQGNTFYSGASSDEWSPARMNGTEPLLDITAGSAWSTDVVNYVTALMNSGTVDGVFVDVLGARLWTSVWGDMSTTEQNTECASGRIQHIE